MVIEQPRAGWYPDPSTEAPFRWWDGEHWSLRTTEDPLRAEAPQLAFAAPLPSRRALRHGETDAPSAASVSAESDAATDRTTPEAATATALATPEFIPLNPLVAREVPHSPSTPEFTAPEAWIENSPAQTSDYAVYGTGLPFSATMIPRAQEPAPVNSFANLGAGFAVIGLLYQAVIMVWGAPSATSYAGLAVAAALVAGVVLGLLGMVRAARFTAAGHRPQRAPGLLVILVCLVALAAQVAVAIGAIVPTGIHDIHLPFLGA
ncbi:DUF2510 domain-containing protein [Frondihabitans australicus]|uniref:Uncharacterized protein DUF2510 n=1 Tax=Frondihabitans australicus TaxID=386892 RepID=A0A495IAW8_9MICO|nr:DUF2510 domain-containing protein [Frondihabitans australicus]RKR73147.1 uncharacterized protein DUF2510 [Frondihabitans australicus]